MSASPLGGRDASGLLNAPHEGGATQPPSNVSLLPAVVPVPGNEITMPPEKRIRSHDAGQLLDHLPPEDLAFDSQPLPLAVAEQNSVLPELLSEDTDSPSGDTQRRPAVGD
jgi:hypothetical protein